MVTSMVRSRQYRACIQIAPMGAEETWEVILQNLYSSFSNLIFRQATVLQLKWVFLHTAMHRVVSSSSTEDDNQNGSPVK